jgi:peroxiredoxin Q/BCP
MLKPGDAIPAFSLPASDGRTISAAGLRGQRYVLYFYPKSDTPGCTRQACAFRDNLPAFGKLTVQVFGISADKEAAQRKFVAKYKLAFPLLADPERQLIEPIGAWVEKSMYGRSYMGIARCTFVIGADGKIERVWEKVSPDANAAEVLAYLGGKPSAAAPVVARGKASAPKAKPVAVKKAAGAAKKAVAAKPVAKKAVAKKAVAKKAVAKKALAKKAAAKKPAPKKSTRR